jgi:hypothetical protein
MNAASGEREEFERAGHSHVWVESGPPAAPYRICDECSARETPGDYDADEGDHLFKEPLL